MSLKVFYVLLACFMISGTTPANCFSESENYYADNRNFSYASELGERNESSFLVINSLDTVVFDFSQAICTPAYVQVPLFILSDDVVYAVDFAMKFNPSEFSFNSLINHQPYLNNSISYNSVDSTLRFSTFSMTAIDNNSPLVSIRFNVSSGMINLNSFDFVQTWLNGDDCSFKAISIPPAPPIVPGGITSINAGDSVLIGITVPSGYTNLWSTGVSSPSIWVFNAGVYSVAVTNTSGCTSTSFITITVNNPLPVELLDFSGNASTNGISVLWTTGTEINNDHFILEHSVDAIKWNFLAEIDGSGTTNNSSSYEYLHKYPAQGFNYYRLRQIDYDGSESVSSVIAIDFQFRDVSQSFKIYPNPSFSGISDLTYSIPSNESSGVLTILELGGKIMLSKVVNVESDGSRYYTISLDTMIPQGIYIVKWNDLNHVGVTRLVVY